MVREEREKAASWGISAAVHLVILLLVTATGLFQAVSSESHPVDVEIYDNVTEDEQPSDGGEAAEEQPAAAEAAAMEAPAMAPIVIDESLKAPEIEKEPKEPKEPQEMKDAKDEKPEKKAEAKPASDKPANPSAAAKPDAKAANGAPGGRDGGSSDKPQGGPACDSSRVKRVKVRAAQPAYPASLQGANAVGSVTVNYIINASGGVESPQIESSSGYPEMDAAALAARKRLYLAVLQGLDMRDLHGPIDGFTVFYGVFRAQVRAVRKAAVADESAHRRVGWSLDALRQHGEPARERLTADAAYIASLELHRAAARPHKPCQQAQERRFSRAVRPDDGQPLAARDIERDILEDGHAAGRIR